MDEYVKNPTTAEQRQTNIDILRKELCDLEQQYLEIKEATKQHYKDKLIQVKKDYLEARNENAWTYHRSRGNVTGKIAHQVKSLEKEMNNVKRK